MKVVRHQMRWHLLNPYDDDDDTQMRGLSRYPLAAVYFDFHAPKLKARYCARKHPQDWYRTLDRVKYALLFRCGAAVFATRRKTSEMCISQSGVVYAQVISKNLFVRTSREKSVIRKVKYRACRQSGLCV